MSLYLSLSISLSTPFWREMPFETKQGEFRKVQLCLARHGVFHTTG